MSPPPPKHSVSVAAAIIDDQGRFLVIRRVDDGRWEPPGGALELDESIEEGLIREVAEETGLNGDPGALTGVYKNRRHGIVALVCRCDDRRRDDPGARRGLGDCVAHFGRAVPHGRGLPRPPPRRD